MKRVRGTNDLKECNEEFVYVEWYDKIYRRIGDGEYVEKRYFTSHDLFKMYGVSASRLSQLLRLNNIRRENDKTNIRLTLQEVRYVFNQ